MINNEYKNSNYISDNYSYEKQDDYDYNKLEDSINQELDIFLKDIMNCNKIPIYLQSRLNDKTSKNFLSKNIDQKIEYLNDLFNKYKNQVNSLSQFCIVDYIRDIVDVIQIELDNYEINSQIILDIYNLYIQEYQKIKSTEENDSYRAMIYTIQKYQSKYINKLNENKRKFNKIIFKLKNIVESKTPGLEEFNNEIDTINKNIFKKKQEINRSKKFIQDKIKSIVKINQMLSFIDNLYYNSNKADEEIGIFKNKIQNIEQDREKLLQKKNNLINKKKMKYVDNLFSIKKNNKNNILNNFKNNTYTKDKIKQAVKNILYNTIFTISFIKKNN